MKKDKMVITITMDQEIKDSSHLEKLSPKEIKKHEKMIGESLQEFYKPMFKTSMKSSFKVEAKLVRGEGK